MMGFTFAPPVIEWGWRIEEEVCIFGWCFEIFYARVGYEFDLGAGLRLPVQMDVQPLDANWPQNVRAEQEYEFSTTITPLDFSRQEFVQFCTDHQLDDEWYIDSCDRFSFPISSILKMATSSWPTTACSRHHRPRTGNPNHHLGG